ncbi:folate-sensitive fragile site protein Fra10Ac1-domain-containing protein [Gautieria morchelliformis]|nr:folate-sensitive fragile site protein Fra10Ac1-domain-containing protein [Gautieria morchelliformis]
MSSLYPVKKRGPEAYTTEFDILKASHKFLRSSDEDGAKSWDAQLAMKYEASLFKEFAVCDLKHYKSGNIALRWRTEDEVLSGAGESSCGNTRCPYYDTPADSVPSGSQDVHLKPPNSPKLTTMELPFSYVEQGESQVRDVMVKVVLCQRCVKKLMWKREREKKDKEEAASDGGERASQTRADLDFRATHSSSRKRADHRDELNHKRTRDSRRSRSPRRHPEFHRIVPEQ